MTRIASDYPGYPAYNMIANNTYCFGAVGAREFISSNVNMKELKDWKVTLQNNEQTADC